MATEARKFGFATQQLHAGYSPDPTTGSRARPALPDHQLPVQEHRARRQSVRAQGTRQHLHPPDEPDHRRARAAHRRLEGGVAGAGGQFRARRAGAGDLHAVRQPATTSSAAAACTAAPTTSSSTRLRKLGIEVTFVDPTDPKNFERAIRPNTKIIYGETLGNPDISVFPFEEVAAIAEEAQHRADDRQHLRHAVPVPPVRVGRQRHHPQHHQVHRRARHQHRRHDRRRRQLRLDQRALRRTSPTPDPSLSRPGLRRPARRGPAALRHQGARPGAARHRRLPVAVQQLADDPGRRDAQPAHGAPRPERAGGGRIPGEASEGQLGQVSRA